MKRVVERCVAENEVFRGKRSQKGESPVPGEVRGFQDGRFGGEVEPSRLMSGQLMWQRYPPNRGGSSNGLQQYVPPCVTAFSPDSTCP